MQRIMIVGAGAVGGTLAGYLARGGREVRVVDTWFQHINAIRANGLTIESPEGRFRVEVPALHIDELGGLRDEIDVAILAVKAYDTEWAYRLIEPYLAEEAVVLSAQNGLVEDQLARYADMSRVIGCSVSFAAECRDPGLVIKRSAPDWPTLAIGELDGPTTPRLERLAALLEPIGALQVSTEIVGKLWAKLAVNAMTNAPCAVTGATSGMVWGETEHAPTSVALAAETARVAEAAGITMQLVFGYISQAALVRAYGPDEAARNDVATSFAEVAARRSGERENRPSMLQDILKGRRTEVEYLNGYVAERGAALGVATPVNAQVARLVREVEQGRRACGPDNLADLRMALKPPAA
jgi:2-dehydropantoate 2-reductase